MKKRDIPLSWSFFVNEKRVNLKHSSSPLPFHSFHTMIKYYHIPFSITWKSHPIYILSFIKFTTPPVCPLYNILTLWIPFQNFQTGDRNKTRGMELKNKPIWHSDKKSNEKIHILVVTILLLNEMYHYNRYIHDWGVAIQIICHWKTFSYHPNNQTS